MQFAENRPTCVRAVRYESCCCTDGLGTYHLCPSAVTVDRAELALDDRGVLGDDASSGSGTIPRGCLAGSGDGGRPECLLSAGRAIGRRLCSLFELAYCQIGVACEAEWREHARDCTWEAGPLPAAVGSSIRSRRPLRGWQCLRRVTSQQLCACPLIRPGLTLHCFNSGQNSANRWIWPAVFHQLLVCITVSLLKS